MPLNRRDFLNFMPGWAVAHKAGEYVSTQIANDIERKLRDVAKEYFGDLHWLGRPDILYDRQLFSLRWGERFIFAAAPTPLSVSLATEVACKLVERFDGRAATLNLPALRPKGVIRV